MIKKLSVCIACILCLALTACSSEIEKREEELPNDTIMETVLPMIQTHYDGILEEDYDKCFGVYAPFYQSAVNDEWYYYNYSSQDEYIKGSADSIKEKFGDDVTIEINVIDTQRLALKRISDYKKLIKNIFALGTPHITDGIEVITEITYSGNLDENTEQTAWYGFLINDEWYLYDAYYEDVSAQFKEEQKNNKNTEPQSTVIVIE